MKFTVLERLMLFNLLPSQGNFLTLKAVKRLRNALTLTEAERQEINMREEPEGSDHYVWDAEIAEPPEIEIDDLTRQIIVGRLKHLDATEQLREEHYALFESFVVEVGEKAT